MPELPEVETVRTSLEPYLIGRSIMRVQLGDYRRCIAVPDPDEFAERLHLKTIKELGRRGKYVLIHLNSGDTATVHLRMTGELSMAEPETPARKHMHLQVDLDNATQLRYYDTRKFGRWSLYTPAEFATFDRSLGIEPLAPELDGPAFHLMLTSRKRILKPLLLDQTFIAGIGNIYADEALFRAGIHPRSHSHMLAEPQAARLLLAIRQVLDEAIEHRGTTLRDYRDGNGTPGDNIRLLRIYTRAAGEPCPVCGGGIRREVIGQRGTKFCPACQPLTRIAT